MPPDVGENYDPPEMNQRVAACECECHDGYGGAHVGTRCMCKVQSFGDFDNAYAYYGKPEARPVASAQRQGDQVEDQRETVTEATGSEWSNAAPAFAHAPDPMEPPRGTVLAYQVAGVGEGVLLDYVTVRAGDGYWYTTGKLAIQGVTWPRLLRHLRLAAVGPVRYATGWAELTLARAATRVDEDD